MAFEGDVVVGALTTSVSTSVGPVPAVPWQPVPLVARVVKGYVPGGVRPAGGPEFVVVSVRVREKLLLPDPFGSTTGLLLNEPVTPVGSGVVISRVIVHALALPPIVTLAVYAALVPGATVTLDGVKSMLCG